MCHIGSNMCVMEYRMTDDSLKYAFECIRKTIISIQLRRLQRRNLERYSIILTLIELISSYF